DDPLPDLLVRWTGTDGAAAGARECRRGEGPDRDARLELRPPARLGEPGDPGAARSSDQAPARPAGALPPPVDTQLPAARRPPGGHRAQPHAAGWGGPHVLRRVRRV